MNFESDDGASHKGQKLSVLSLPLVVRVNVLSYMNLKDHFSLRQVCKITREWIDNSSLPHHSPLTVIYDHGTKTFTKFLERRPPHVITSIHFKNETWGFLNDTALPWFIQVYAASITSLRIQQFFPCTTSQEISFFEAFTSLEELIIDQLSIPSAIDLATLFPSTFKNLKTLKLGSVKAYPEPPGPDDSFGATLIPFARQRPMGIYAWSLIRYCDNIEHLGYPKTSKYFFQAFTDGRGRGEFGLFCDYVRDRYLRNPGGPQLKTCDFANDNFDPDTKNALPILKLGSEFGIKFLNLNANLFQYIKIEPLIKMYDLPNNAGDCIVSFKNFNCLISKCLPSIQKISMSASQVNTMLDYSCIFNGPKTFPNLREIEIVIDVGFSVPETDIYGKAREFRDVKSLLSHFFYDMEMIYLEDPANLMEHVRKYEGVDSLTIKFAELSSSGRKPDPEDLPLEWIANSLPNLRKLKLDGWTTLKKDTYNRFLESFSKLEELILRDCDYLEELCLETKDTILNEIRSLKSLVRISLMGKSETPVFNEQLNDSIEELGFTFSNFLESTGYQSQMTWIREPWIKIC